MALLLPIVAMLAVGVADLGRGYAVRTGTANAAEAAARAVAKTPADAGNQAQALADATTAASASQDGNFWTAFSCSIPSPYNGAPNPVLPVKGTNGAVYVYVQCRLNPYLAIVKAVTGDVSITSLAATRAEW